jgi:hypothetical protein
MPQFLCKGRGCCKAFGSMRMRRGNQSPKVEARAGKYVHVNTITVPQIIERKKR